MTKTPIQIAAHVPHVREVSLLGSADLDYWTERLGAEHLVPFERNGKARIQIMGASMKFKGVRFSELSFSVVLAPHGPGAPEQSCFLVHAFNSFRFFAFCERVFFSTPYYYGDCSASVTPPISMQLKQRGAHLFRAEMQSNALPPPRPPLRSGDEGFDGTVFLPGARHFFHAEIKGDAQVYPFVPSEDAYFIAPSQDVGILKELQESQFSPEEWCVRSDATHAKSKTFDGPE